MELVAQRPVRMKKFPGKAIIATTDKCKDKDERPEAFVRPWAKPRKNAKLNPLLDMEFSLRTAISTSLPSYSLYSCRKAVNLKNPRFVYSFRSSAASPCQRSREIQPTALRSRFTFISDTNIILWLSQVLFVVCTTSLQSLVPHLPQT